MQCVEQRMLFGNRSTFAIEAEADLAQSSLNGVRGRIRLWLGGVAVGDFNDDQLLDEAVLVLQSTSPVRAAVDTEFTAKRSSEILDALYRPDLGVSEGKSRFLFCPWLGSAFDAVYATRIRWSDHDEICWRTFGDTAAYSVNLPSEGFDAAVARFTRWVEKVRATLVRGSP